MSTNHNRIKVADLETNEPNKTLITNDSGELEFSDITGGEQDLQQTLTKGNLAYLPIVLSSADSTAKLNVNSPLGTTSVGASNIDLIKSGGGQVTINANGTIQWVGATNALFTLPSKPNGYTGELATLDDISGFDDFVSKTGEVSESIDGNKTFIDTVTFKQSEETRINIDGNVLKFITNDNSSSSTISPVELSGHRTQLLPDKDGTFAMLEDIGGSQDLQSILDYGNISQTPIKFINIGATAETDITNSFIEQKDLNNNESTKIMGTKIYGSSNNYNNVNLLDLKRQIEGNTAYYFSDRPNGSYAIATITDIPDTSNFIHKTGEVTEIIDGHKIFRFPTTFRGDASSSYINIDSDYLTFITEAYDNNSIKLIAKQNSGAENENYTQELQAKNGVIALLSDFKTINGVSLIGNGNIVTSSIPSGTPNSLSKYNAAGNNLTSSNITDNGSNIVINKPTEINSGIANSSGLKFTNLKFQSGYSYSTFANIPLYGNGIVKDSNNNLFVSAGSVSTITKITPTGIVSTFATIPSWAICLAIDSNNNVFVGGSTGIINKITPTGTVSTFLNAGGQVINIIIDKSDNIYFAKQIDNKIYKLTPSGILSTFSTLAGYVYGLYVNDNYFYATDNQNNTVSKISLSGTILNTYNTGLSPRFVIATDFGIIYTANWNNGSSGSITKILPDGTISTIASSVGSGYTRMEKDESNNIYVATTGNGIVKVSPDDTTQFLSPTGNRTTALLYVNSAIFTVNADSSSITKILLPDSQKPLSVDANGNVVLLNNLGYDAPTSATAIGTKGDVRITSQYIYWCVATNVWVRTPTSTF